MIKEGNLNPGKANKIEKQGQIKFKTAFSKNHKKIYYLNFRAFLKLLKNKIKIFFKI